MGNNFIVLNANAIGNSSNFSNFDFQRTSDSIKEDIHIPEVPTKEEELFIPDFEIIVT